MCVSCSLLLWGFSVAAASISTILGTGQIDQAQLGPNAVFAAQEEDPITKFRVIFPMNGDVETLPLVFRAEIEVTSIESFSSHYGDKVLCFELNRKWKECSPLSKPNVMFSDLPMGNYMVQAFITDEAGATRYRETMFTTVSVVTKNAFDTCSAAMQEQNDGHEVSERINILEWARKRQGELTHRTLTEDSGINSHDADPPDPLINSSAPLLVIGIKTAITENFALRQAIRETWANPQVLPHDVKVIFVGFAPSLTALHSVDEQEQIQKAIDLEKQIYGDLLTDELHSEDSSNDLLLKVKKFMQFTTKAFPQTSFVMIADDDIYLRADRLADDLRKEDRTERLYIGQVWDQLLGRRQTPVRNTTERYYISEKSYPLHEYPPFAFGPHYLMSMDCARFIAMNGERLHGLGGMDDVSIAMWLLTIQVHVEHTPTFTSLRFQECDNRIFSLADLSPFAIQAIHTNLVERRDLCYGFDQFAWQKINRLDSKRAFQHDHTPQWEIQTYMHNLENTEYLLVTSIISTRDKAGVKVSYFPSAETFHAYSRRVCLEVFSFVASLDYKSWMCRGITQKLRTRLQQQFHIAETSKTISLAFLELWRHNLFVADQDESPYIIAYSSESSYASIVFECIFKTIFESQKRPILVVPEEALHVSYGSKPDVFLFSIFDADCDPMSNPVCSEMIAYYTHHYLPPARESEGRHFSKLMMISGEAIDTQNLDDRVPLLSSVSDVPRKWHVYLPVASISFAERLRHSPMALLSAVPISESGERQFCAYLYARCDRMYRETMFDLLNSMEPVDALGVCAGSSRPPDKSYQMSRYSKWFNDEAVITYQRYKFVIAFENSAEPGYVTEKLVNPLLAGSIPIYLGNSTTASQLFNPDSYIDCGRFEKLADCAEYVLQVHKSPELYARMRSEPPIRNITAFNEVFSWHPSVPSRALADKVARMLGL